MLLLGLAKFYVSAPVEVAAIEKLHLRNLYTSHMCHQNSHHPCGQQVGPAQRQLHGDNPANHEPVLRDRDVRGGEAQVCLALSSICQIDCLVVFSQPHFDSLIPVFRQELEKHLRAVLLRTEGRPSPDRTSL